MELGDYLASSRHHRDCPTVLLNVVKYLLLTIVFISSLYLIVILSTFLLNQDAWIQSASEELEASITLFTSDRQVIPSTTHLPPSTINQASAESSPVQDQVISPNYVKQLVNLRVEMFLIKTTLGLVYFAIGFIALVSEDYYISLFYSFTSIVGLLLSLTKLDDELQFALIIYATIVSVLSLIYCGLLKFMAITNKSQYYYGYLQS